MKIKTSKFLFSWKISLLIILLLISIIYLSIQRKNAVTIGNDVGSMLGIASGKVMGSRDGLLEAKDAYDAGVQQGLSNEDTTAKIGNAIKEVENLEVLVASIKLKDMHNIGNNTEYAALYLLKGDAVFTVDLSQSTFEEDNESIYINIPLPEMKLIIDQSKIEKVAEYQKFFFSGSAEKGFDDYINMMKKIAEETPKTLANYDVLMESAKDSAQKQVKSLAESITLQDKNIYVGFLDTEEK